MVVGDRFALSFDFSLSGHEVFQHFESVIEVVFVLSAIAFLYDVEGRELGQNDVEQAATMQIDKAFGGMRGEHNLVEFVDDAFARNYADALFVASEGFEGFRFNLEVELRGKADASHHPKRIVAEGDVGVERRGNDAVFQVAKAVEWVHQFSKTCLIEAEGEGVDGEIAPPLVVVERPILDDGFARVVAVTLLSRSYKFEFFFHLSVFAFVLHPMMPFHLSRSEVAEYRAMCPLAQTPCKGLGHFNARTHHDDVDIFRRPFQQQIAHIAADDVGFDAQRIDRGRKLLKDGSGKSLGKFRLSKHFHNVRLCDKGKNEEGRGDATPSESKKSELAP